MTPLRVLVACEFSGIVRDAFIAKGHDAVSCDLLPSERPGPHIEGDVLAELRKPWDMMIAFPPCTHLCSSGAVYWPQKQVDGRQRAAADFFLSLVNAPIHRVAVENPVGIMSRLYRKPDQIINPCQFGQPFLKKTCLWLNGLPLLVPTNVVQPTKHWHGGSPRGGKKKDGTRTASKLMTALKYGWKERSRTFQGIATAMADQWGAKP